MPADGSKPVTQESRIDPASAIYDAGLQIQDTNPARASELFQVAAAILCNKPIPEAGLAALQASESNIAESQRPAVLEIIRAHESTP